jgi:hypothetical protein
MTEQAARSLGEHDSKLAAINAKAEADLTANAQNTASTSIHFVNLVTSISNTTMLQQLYQQALISQRMQVTPDSTSVVLNNVSQTMTVEMMASLASTFYNTNFLKSVSNYTQRKDYSKLYEEYQKNRVSLRDIHDTITDLVANSFWRMIWIVVGLLLFFLLVVAALMFFQPEFLFGSDVMASAPPSAVVPGTLVPSAVVTVS